jgi:t-SNARE complex subunit (syntaxin)
MAKPNKQTGAQKRSKMTSSQRKMRAQQIILAVIGIVVIISMILALTMKF